MCGSLRFSIASASAVVGLGPAAAAVRFSLASAIPLRRLVALGVVVWPWAIVVSIVLIPIPLSSSTV